MPLQIEYSLTMSGPALLESFCHRYISQTITSVRVLHTTLLTQFCRLKPITTKILTKFQKRSSFGYLNFIWPSFGGKYCRQRYFAETTLDLRTTYINAWSEWNVSVLPMTLFTICFLIFHERKGGKWSCLVDYTPSVLCPQKKACRALTKGLCVTNVRSFDESLEVITRKTYHELSVFVGGIHQRSTIVCKNSNQCGHD